MRICAYCSVIVSFLLLPLAQASSGPTVITSWPSVPALENGDTNGDWDRDLSDAIYLLTHLFNGGPAPVPLACAQGLPSVENGDTNGDATRDVSDAIGLLGWLYSGSQEPVVACSSGAGAGKGPRNYVFTVVTSLGSPAPGDEGGEFVTDFEPYGINNRGQLAFAADVSTGGEGVFVASRGELAQVVRSGQPAPGGGDLEFFGVWGHTALNDPGEVAFVFTLAPFSFPVGMNSGVYLYSPRDQTTSALVVPGVTPAPGGGTFEGAFLHADINNEGAVVFAGIVPTLAGISGSSGMGVFRVGTDGQISSVVSPGDPAPGGSTFDFAENPSINGGGDVAFGGHIAGDECVDFGVPQDIRIFCAESVFVRWAATGSIDTIARQGEPAPGGGTYRLAFGPVINSRGQILYVGDLTAPPGAGEALGIFLSERGTSAPVARPGDALPGGGSIANGPFNVANYHLNNRGDVAFAVTLDTDANGDGIADTGLYVATGGALRLVAKTGTEIPGVGTVAHLQPPVEVGDDYPHSNAIINDHGQVFFQVTLSDGAGVLLVATPRP